MKRKSGLSVCALIFKRQEDYHNTKNILRNLQSAFNKECDL